MLKILVKKQLAEFFRQYFYNAKKNEKRTKAGVIGLFALYFFIIVVLLGGAFTIAAVNMCPQLNAAGLAWLYFTLMAGIAIVLGAFGSVFNTYQSLYLSKDNDLLLSMPIPVNSIIASRILGVYIMGSMYSLVVMLPAIIVYWVTAGATLARIVCGLVLTLAVTVVVLVLSCLLGWAVAKISLKIKNKSFVTTIASLLFIAAYYYVYFNAQKSLQTILLNADELGLKIKGSAYAIYMFGSTGEGNWLNAGIVLLVVLALAFAAWKLLSKSFLSIAISTGVSKKTQYVEKTAKERSAFRALLGKEFAHFTSSSGYMLNSGLGIILMPITGIVLLIKGPELMVTFLMLFSGNVAPIAVLLTAALCILCSMNTMGACEVSLEGKSLWILQSLPIDTKTILRAKTAMHAILTVVPMAVAVACTGILMAPYVNPALLAHICSVPIYYALFSSEFAAFLGIKMPNTSWTNELTVVKQSGAIMIAIFGGWAFCAAIGGVYFLLGGRISATNYLAICGAILLLATVLLQLWMDKKGCKSFASL